MWRILQTFPMWRSLKRRGKVWIFDKNKKPIELFLSISHKNLLTNFPPLPPWNKNSRAKFFHRRIIQEIISNLISSRTKIPFQHSPNMILNEKFSLSFFIYFIPIRFADIYTSQMTNLLHYSVKVKTINFRYIIYIWSHFVFFSIRSTREEESCRMNIWATSCKILFFLLSLPLCFECSPRTFRIFFWFFIYSTLWIYLTE